MNKQFKATINTLGGKKFSFTWTCSASALVSSTPQEIFLLQDEFMVKETPMGAQTFVPTKNIDCYTLAPMKDMN